MTKGGFGGFVQRELIDEKLERISQSGAQGPDALGFKYAAELVQSIEDHPSTPLTEAEGLDLKAKLIHSSAVSPVQMTCQGATFGHILGLCEPFLFVNRVSPAFHVGFPQDFDTEPIPWPSTTRGTVLKAAMAAMHLGTHAADPCSCRVAHKLASRVLAALGDGPAAAAVQAELAAARSHASLADIKYVCSAVLEKSLGKLAEAQRPGSRERSRLMAERKAAAEGLLAAKPQSGQGYLVLSVLHFDGKEWDEAVAACERGIEVADASGDRFNGAFLRNALGARLVARAAETGGSVAAGRLRQLLREAKECMEDCRAWAPSTAVKEIKEGELSRYVREARGKADDELVEYDGVPSGPQGSRPPSDFRRTCAACGLQLADAKLCGGCRKVAFCSRACQKAHWLAGHRDECKRG